VAARDKFFEDDTPSISSSDDTNGANSAALRVLIVVVPVNKWMEFWKVLWNDVGSACKK
jgi:hypothetical protein